MFFHFGKGVQGYRFNVLNFPQNNNTKINRRESIAYFYNPRLQFLYCQFKINFHLATNSF